MCASVRCWGAPEAARSTSVDVGHVAECLVMSRCLSPYRSREPRLRFGGKLLLCLQPRGGRLRQKNNLRGDRLVATVARALCTPTHQVRLPAFYLPYSMINHLHDMARMRIAPATRITMFPGHFSTQQGSHSWQLRALPFLCAEKQTFDIFFSFLRFADAAVGNGMYFFAVLGCRSCGTRWQSPLVNTHKPTNPYAKVLELTNRLPT